MNTVARHITHERSLIVIAEADARRLAFLLQAEGPGRDATHLRDLRDELERAVIVPAEEVPEGVITMHGCAQVLDLASGVRQELSLVYPHDADPARGRISVLAPLGTALLGYRAGDEISWNSPAAPAACESKA